MDSVQECSAADAVCSAAAGAAASADASFLHDMAQRWDTFHASLVATGDAWLDHAAAVDLTTKTTTSTATTATMSWSNEWSEFVDFGSWPEWDYYQQAALSALEDGWKGLQSVFYWLWLTIQPVLYSVSYLVWRFLQATVGAFLPYFQRGFIAVCRFHLHLTWQMALGEVALFASIYFSWKMVVYLRKQQYLRRTKRYIRGTWLKVQRSVQDTYREIAHVSLLLAMAIPHAAYLGLVVMLKVFYPSWITKLSTETMAPSFFKFWYPIVFTIAALHHARAFHADSDDQQETSSFHGVKLKPTKGRKVLQDITEERSSKKKKSRRKRRSSVGALLHGAAPGQAGAAADPMAYTQEDMNEDVRYWLNYWVLYSILKAAYSLASTAMFVGTLLSHETVHSVLCQLDFLFYVWIFCLPQCLLILFPSAGEEERRDWSKSKQWCYDCALNPVLAIPSLFLPMVDSCFDKVSHAVSPELWGQYVVDKVKPVLGIMTMMKMLSEERKDALLEHISNFNPLVLPAITLLSPSIVTQYGVWYVQFLVPQARSYRALARERRSIDRILYLKFWVLHAIATVLIQWAHTVFWIVPLKTHMTFVVWCVFIMPRFVNAVYNELDRELQAFRLLPPVHDGLSVEKTHTARAMSMIYAALPKAQDVDKTTNGADKENAGEAPASKTQPAADDNGGTAGGAGAAATSTDDDQNSTEEAKTDAVSEESKTEVEPIESLGDNGGKENSIPPLSNTNEEDSSSSSKKETETSERRRSSRLQQTTTN